MPGRIRFGNADDAKSADNALRAEGVFLRAQGGAGLPDCLRVTIGETDDMNLTAALLKRWKEGEKT